MVMIDQQLTVDISYRPFEISTFDINPFDIGFEIFGIYRHFDIGIFKPLTFKNGIL